MGYLKHFFESWRSDQAKVKKIQMEIRQEEQDRIQKIFTITDIDNFDRFFENKIVPLLKPLEEKRKNFIEKTIVDKLSDLCITLPLLFIIGLFDTVKFFADYNNVNYFLIKINHFY